MGYDDLMELVLRGSSVNSRAHELGIPQRTLAKYVKAENLPDCDGAILLARAAGVSIEEAVLAIAAKKAELRPERVHSFLRPAMASVLAFVVSVNLFLTPAQAEAAPAKARSSISQPANFILCKIKIISSVRS